MELDAKWTLWQTGVSLNLGTILIFKIWEVPFLATATTQLFRNPMHRFKLKLDGVWSDINLSSSSILEVYFPISNIDVYKQTLADDPVLVAHIQPNMAVVAKLLALVVDHIDLLLEDWYPALGTRFVHTSEGRFLITRLALCPKCLQKLVSDNSERAYHAANCIGSGGVPVESYSANKNKFCNQRALKLNESSDERGMNLFSAYVNATERCDGASEVSFFPI